MTTPAIRFLGISKRFPGVAALADVSFDVLPGSCHAVCGENGAGKSTLGRILAGFEVPDAGEIQLDGNSVKLGSPRDALRAGIAMVHQELVFCDNLTVADNLCLNDLPSQWGFIDRLTLNQRAAKLLEAVGAAIDPTRQMATLSVAEQQLVQIAAAVGESARVIIFDEPTSSLGEAEVVKLYALIRALRARGVAIIYISHRMPEIFELADMVTVLRDGKHVSTRRTDALDESSLVQLMIGRRLEQSFPAHLGSPLGQARLRVDALSLPGHFEGISFTLRAGEVVGLGGLVGAGRTEIGQAIFGLHAGVRGRINVGESEVRIESPRAAMALGIAYLPEDRKRQGLVLSMTSRDNTTLPTLEQYASWSWIDHAAEDRTVNELFGRLRVRATRQSIVATLSGGNQQKVVMAKWLAAESDILILDEPTRGVDVGAKAEIHAWIDRLASEGVAILLISSELPELLNLSRRILVLRSGRLVGEIPREEATQEVVMRMMAGVPERE